MKIKIFLLFLSFLISQARAQEASCNFVNSSVGYTCYLTINNPLGAEITEITGEHAPGLTNEDVFQVYSWDGVTANIPQQICNQFTNVVQLDLAFLGIRTVGENSFSGCGRLNYLRLWNNEITELPSNVFANNRELRYIDLDTNNLTSIPENIFAGLTEIRTIELRNNPLGNLPLNLFAPLENLQSIYISNIGMTTYNPSLFANNPNLELLFIYNNQIETLPANAFSNLSNLFMLDLGVNPFTQNFPANAFSGLNSLTYFYADGCGQTEINSAWFEGMERLVVLAIYQNQISQIPENAFNALSNLLVLDVGYNPIADIPAGTFRALTSLNSLYLNSLRLTTVNPAWFVTNNLLQYLFLNFNDIEELPLGVFTSFNGIFYIGLWRNRIKTLSRRHFGSLSSLYYLDLDENNVNALDRGIFESAGGLMVFYFFNNVCASGSFFDFNANRVQNMDRLQRCFRNYEFSVETSTTGIEDYRIFGFPDPGVVFRVNAPERVHLSLNPVNFEAVPRMEILLGEHNNTRSIIRRNGEEDVVNIETRNILNVEGWSGFRVVFVNWMVLVYREGDQFPFMGFNMVDFYPVRFYGIRAPGNVVPWIIQPLDFEPSPPPPPPSPAA